MVENRTFVGKINTSGADGVGLDETKLQLKLEHIVYHAMRSMNTNDWNAFIITLPAIYNIFRFAASRCEVKDSPFAYYFNTPSGIGGRRVMGLLFPRPSAFYSDKAKRPMFMAGGDDNTVDREEWWDLGRSYIRFIKFSEFLDKMSEFINRTIGYHLRATSATMPKYVDLTTILTHSPLKYFKQTYDNSGQKGQELQENEPHIISRIVRNVRQGTVSHIDNISDDNDVTVFNISMLAEDGRWNNVFEFVWSLITSNLLKPLYSDLFLDFINSTNNNQWNLFPATIDKVLIDPKKVVIDDIVVNDINPLDNIDICYLDNTPDDIKNHRQSNNTSNTSDDYLTIQTVWHNQPPNNANGWTISGVWQKHSANLSVVAYDASNKIFTFENWGVDIIPNDPFSSFRMDLNKPAQEFVYNLFYFENGKSIANNMLSADFPVLVHNGENLPLFNTEQSGAILPHRTTQQATQITRNIQDKGCIHNTINKIIKENFTSPTEPHITLQLSIHFRTLQEIVTPRIYSTKDIQFIKFNIDTVTRFGIDLSSAKGWDILESSVDCITGICKFKLANRKK